MAIAAARIFPEAEEAIPRLLQLQASRHCFFNGVWLKSQTQGELYVGNT